METRKDSNLCRNPIVPSQLQLNCDLFSSEMYIESNTIDSVFSTSSFCRFIIPNTAFLSPNTTLKLQLKTPAGMTDTGTNTNLLPANIGAFSLIDRVDLKSNNKTIFSSNQENYYQSFKQLFSNSNRNYYVKGCENGIYDSVYENMDTVGTGNTQNVLMIKSEFEHDDANDSHYANDFLRLSDGIEFQIKLTDLIPWIREMLPMYLMKEEISLELYFNQESNYFQGRGSAETAIIQVDPTETKLLVDTILFNEDVMEDYATRNKNITIQNEACFVWSRLFTQDANFNFGGGQYEIGGKGKFVTGLVAFWVDNATAGGYNPNNKIYGKYGMNAPITEGAYNEYNVLINGENLYPVNVKNMAHQFSEITKFDYFTDPQILRDLFLDDGSAYIDGSNFETKHLANSLGKSKSAIYIPINRMVNNDGIILSITRFESGVNAHPTQILKVFLMVREVINIDTERGAMFQRYLTQ